MLGIIKQFERFIILALVVMMALVLLFATVELGWIILKDLFSPPLFILEIEELVEIFGLFMLVLIGVELLESIVKSYLRQTCDHVRIVISVAIIAIARKVIILDIKQSSESMLLGLAGLLLVLCVSYFLINWRRWKRTPEEALECCDE